MAIKASAPDGPHGKTPAAAADDPPPKRANDSQLVVRTSVRSQTGLWFLLGASVLLFGWSSAKISGFAAAPTIDTFAVSFSALLWVIVYLTSTYAVFGTVYLLATAYILPLLVFHFGTIAQDGFGLIKVGGYVGDFGNWITLAGWYVNLALACIGVAFAAACLLFRPPPPLPRQAASKLAANNLDRLRNLAIGMCFACAAFLVIGIAQVGNILSYDRFSLFFGGMDIRGVALFNWVAPSTAVALVISAQSRRQKQWSYLVGLLMLIIFLFSGNRSMLFFPLLIGVVLWVKTGRRVPTLAAGGLVVLTLLVIPVLGALRMQGTYDTLTLDKIDESSTGSSISGALRELGGSAGVLGITLQYIPAEEPYRMGSSYLNDLRNAIPNIGASLDASNDPRQILRQSGSLSEGLLRLSPARWASVKVYGVQYALYGNQGVGFSAVAEPYFNFGYLGVVGFFLAVGFGLARMECPNLLLDFGWLTFTSLFYWLFIMTVRNDLGDFTKPASFILISLGIWVVVRRFTPFARP